MTPTEQFIHTLKSLGPADLGRLRQHSGLSLDESVDGFDLFAGLWWPLRKKNREAPRRDVAWLIAKLHALRPLRHVTGAALPSQLGSIADKHAVKRTQYRFDELLSLPLGQIEPALQWALTLIGQDGRCLDWVRLTDDLSNWEREATRLRWARQYLRITGRHPD